MEEENNFTPEWEGTDSINSLESLFEKYAERGTFEFETTLDMLNQRLDFASFKRTSYAEDKILVGINVLEEFMPNTEIFPGAMDTTLKFRTLTTLQELLIALTLREEDNYESKDFINSVMSTAVLSPKEEWFRKILKTGIRKDEYYKINGRAKNTSRKITFSELNELVIPTVHRIMQNLHSHF